ncbi:hypothetical protein SNE40_017447 [Patella caerulea]|uniref:Ubiquitin-like domain-containing protein n=1 Tax=Patella caerulea TaxID=87958 RepID=A0AAN8JF32_PATCE
MGNTETHNHYYESETPERSKSIDVWIHIPKKDSRFWIEGISEDLLVSELKGKIQWHTCIPSNQQILFYIDDDNNQHEMKNSYKLSDYGVVNKVTIYVAFLSVDDVQSFLCDTIANRYLRNRSIS